MKEMAPEIQTVGPGTSATQRREWGEREVRRLLRGLRRPHTLAMEPLARLLCDIYAVENPYDASLRFIAETFVNGGLVGKRLFELIQTCDVQATKRSWRQPRRWASRRASSSVIAERLS